jgi:hypothetical protein
LKCSGRHAAALVAASWLLVGPAPFAAGQIIQKLPMLQTYRSHEVWLQWETDSDPGGTAHVVEWGLASVDENQTPSTETIALDGSHFVHRAVLSGLAPATGYRYRVRSGASASPEFRFRTASAAPNAPFRVAWVADNQNAAGTPFADVLAQLDLHDPDFIGHAGDTVDSGGAFADWQSQWFDRGGERPGAEVPRDGRARQPRWPVVPRVCLPLASRERQLVRSDHWPHPFRLPGLGARQRSPAYFTYPRFLVYIED